MDLKIDLIIKSVGFKKSSEKSGITLNKKFYPASRGINIYILFNLDYSDNPNNLDAIFKNYDTCANDETDNIIGLIKYALNSSAVYIIFLVDDEAYSLLNLNKIKDFSDNNNLDLIKIMKLNYRDGYYFIYDNKCKKLIYEKIEKVTLIKDLYLIDIGQNEISRKPTIYIVCTLDLHALFVEYIESIKEIINIIYLQLDNTKNYDYDSNDVYIFCQTIDNHHGKFEPISIEKSLINRQFNKFIINMEQMTIVKRNKLTQWHLDNNVKVIDYSIENIQLLQTVNPDSVINHIPYQFNPNEINKLKQYMNISKLFDVAYCGCMSPRRKKILNDLRDNGISVYEISAWGDHRDRSIPMCKILINIHFDDDYNIYESLRCDRWAFAKMPVVSEDSIYTELLDVKKYNLVQFYNYESLVTGVINTLNNLSDMIPTDENIAKVAEERKNILETIQFN
jgi:hypothetical protein